MLMTPGEPQDLAEKLALFRAGNAIPARQIAAGDLADLRVKHERFLKTLLFEGGVGVNCFVRAPFGSSFIGAHSYINGGSYVRENVFVGRFCSIGGRVSLGARAHGVNGLSTSPAIHSAPCRAYTPDELDRLGLKDEAPEWPTVLENDVWIGDGAVIRVGVTIGTGAIVAANAVVSQDVLPYQIVGGVPARPLRFRFPEDVVSRLLASAWWERPLPVLSALPTDNILEFLDAVEAGDLPPAEPVETYCLFATS